MSLILDGTNGLSDVDGTAATPAIRGTDTNTGIFFPAADTIAFAEGGTEVARFDSNGNLGIGTASPTSKLDVSGELKTLNETAATGVIIKRTGGVNANGAVNFVGSDDAVDASIRMATDVANALTFTTGGTTERMRIDSSGNLLVGTVGISTGTFKGIQNAAGGADANYLSRNSSGTANRQWSFGMNSADQYVVYGYNTTTFNSGAYIAWGGTSWTASSDERLKDIIEPITDAVNKVSTLRTVIGKYKTDEEGTRRAFLIAQDVQVVLPEAVDATDPERLGVSYTDVIPLLVASIKELKTELDSVKAELATLKGAA